MNAPSLPLSSNDSDMQLVQRTVAGDQRAYELLVIKYQRRIERLIARMVRDHDLVQDIAQETFLRAYRALPQFRGEAQFYTWLYRIATNVCLDLLSSRRCDRAERGVVLKQCAGSKSQCYGSSGSRSTIHTATGARAAVIIPAKIMASPPIAPCSSPSCKATASRPARCCTPAPASAKRAARWPTAWSS